MKIINSTNCKIALFEIGPLSTNCYVIFNINKNAIIIDFAFYDQEIFNLFKTENLNLNAIFLTHGHFDHFMGVQTGIEKLNRNCPIFIHELDKTILTDSQKNASLFMNLNENLNLNEIKTFNKEFQFNLDNTINLKVVHTPGHTAGSCSFLLNDEILFTGDSLFKNSVGRTDLFSGSQTQTLNTIELFKLMNPKLKIMPGHGPLSTLEMEFLNSPIFQN